MTAISGNTYPHRVALRAMGGVWSKKRQEWLVPDSRAEEAKALVESGPSREQRLYGSRVTRFSSGAVVYQNRRGRCEDAPCCGCCS